MRTFALAAALLCLCQSLFAVPPGSPFLEPAEPYPTQFEQSFLRSKIDDSTLKIVGSKEFLRPTLEGLVISIGQGVSEEVERIGVEYPLPMKGDGDVRATVELLSFPRPSEGYGTGVILAFEDGVDRGGTLQFLGGDGGNRTYTAHHFTKDADGNYDHQVTSFPTAASRAVLRLRREGARLTYLVSEDDGATFNELKSIEFTDRPLKMVQLYGQRGGKPNALNARLIDVSIASPQVTLRSETVAPQPEPSWFLWIAAGSIVVIAFIAGAFVLWRRST